MPCYPEPALNPHCECRMNPMRAFFCATGHMLECHYPYNCIQAGCSHLPKYDIEPEEVDRLQQLAVERLQAGRLKPYRLGENAGDVVQVD